MRLDCYKIHEWAPEIVPGQGRREWMDASHANDLDSVCADF